MPPPIFVVLVSVLEVAAFIYYCVELNEISAIGPVPWKSMWIYNPCKRHEVWRFFSYIFIHAGFFHVFFNVLIQLLLGIPLEMVHKWWRVGIVYIAGVVAGSLASSITDPYSYLAGASGGVYALLAAHLASVVIVSFFLSLFLTDNAYMSLTQFSFEIELARDGIQLVAVDFSADIYWKRRWRGNLWSLREGRDYARQLFGPLCRRIGRLLYWRECVAQLEYQTLGDCLRLDCAQHLHHTDGLCRHVQSASRTILYQS